MTEEIKPTPDQVERTGAILLHSVNNDHTTAHTLLVQLVNEHGQDVLITACIWIDIALRALREVTGATCATVQLELVNINADGVNIGDALPAPMLWAQKLFTARATNNATDGLALANSVTTTQDWLIHLSALLDVCTLAIRSARGRPRVDPPWRALAERALNLEIKHEHTEAWQVVAELAEQHGPDTVREVLLFWIDQVMAKADFRPSGNAIPTVQYARGETGELIAEDDLPPAQRWTRDLILARVRDDAPAGMALLTDDVDDIEWNERVRAVLAACAHNIAIGL